MIKTDRVVVVEGRYDKIKLQSVLDAVIIETDGFGIFNNAEKQRLLRRLAEKRGLLVLTDSDSAGFTIRNFLKGIVPPEQIVHAYIPDIFGKEKRKAKPSKEGKLGVEGVPAAVLTEALQKAGVDCEETDAATRRPVTKTDFYEDGLSGSADSADLRARFLRQNGLPARMTANGLLEAVNILMTYDEYKSCLRVLKDAGKE
jgi:ribonuclease M5